MLSTPVAPQGSVTTADWLAGLAGAPLPTRRQEDWRFTDLAALRRLQPCLADAAAAPWTVPALPEGISPLPPEDVVNHLDGCLAAAGCLDHWPVRLNRGACPAVLALRVCGAAAPLELGWDAAAGAGLQARRLLLVLEAGASLDLLQVIRASGPQALSLVVEVEMGAGSRLSLGTLAAGGDGQASLLAHTAVRQARESSLQLVTASVGWALLRQEPRIVQAEGEASTSLRALQLVKGDQIADTHSQVRFDGPAGTLDQLHKAVADERGHSIFNGAVQVPRAAQRTNASQLSRNLLLSDRARVDTKPELEIVADDVKCAHGATVTRLEREQLFYLQSRGIGAAQAAALLQRGFCEEVLRALPAAAAAHQPLQTLLGAA
ncbi:Fe-S cluster assembly protein SufD [Cyanobium sp. NIES-981]|uniref:Fe-S cluster assembly protein SufD n=1 Tax=Cyanobium sp. NIES-981 TaxID=1851505 RepID=UPI0007DD5BF5|nr:Fe-S cluster assembly protein SufD [Cyanobium sp. NIES-981]SBO44732.1 ABC transporter, membrane component [Cyanobium sp. NIES-981]